MILEPVGLLIELQTAQAKVARLTRERDALKALLLEVLPLVIWHQTSGMDGETIGPESDLVDRVRAALEG